MVARQPSRPVDEEIRGAVRDALARDGRIHEFDVIQIEVQDGSVLLSGAVETDREKLWAEDLARQVPRVRSVDNRLTVAVNRPTSDAQIESGVLSVFAGQPAPIGQIGCQVQDGIVTLLGRVRDVADEPRAIDLAAGVRGVEAVQSDLQIQPEVQPPAPLRVDDATLVGRVADALSDPTIEIRQRNIRVFRAVATIHGTVDSDAMRRKAAEVIASVEGIQGVKTRPTAREVYRAQIGRKVDWLFPRRSSEAGYDQPGVIVCPRCHAISLQKRWFLDECRYQTLAQQAGTRQVVCPGCRRLERQIYEGDVLLSSPLLAAHNADALQLIRNEEDRARRVDPLSRLADVDDRGDQIAVLTTTVSLAERIGKAFHRAFKGQLRLEFLPDERFVRVRWKR